jgi:hypothetical protein
VSWLNAGIAGDDAKVPSDAERQAVATLAAKGAVIFIDGEFQITQVLGGRELGNDDLRHLRVFKKLRSLSLSNAKIDDGGLATLKSLSQLQSLNLSAGSLSADAQQELKQALPNCRVIVPDRRGFGGGPPRTATSPPSSFDRQSGWGAFEFPPLTPSPSLSVEVLAPSIQERLKLTAEQKQEIARVTGRDYQRQQTEDAIKKVLTAEQQAQMQQVLLQREGPTALVLPKVSAELKLTDEQQAAVNQIMDERRAELLKVGDQLRGRTLDFGKSIQETERVKASANDRLLAVLTDAQRKQWTAMIGPPLPSTSGERPFGLLTPEETGRTYFRNLDRDNDGKLTAEEWQRSRNTRLKFEQHQISLELPATVEAFVKKYVEMDAAARKAGAPR